MWHQSCAYIKLVMCCILCSSSTHDAVQCCFVSYTKEHLRNYIHAHMYTHTHTHMHTHKHTHTYTTGASRSSIPGPAPAINTASEHRDFVRQSSIPKPQASSLQQQPAFNSDSGSSLSLSSHPAAHAASLPPSLVSEGTSAKMPAAGLISGEQHHTHPTSASPPTPSSAQTSGSLQRQPSQRTPTAAPAPSSVAPPPPAAAPAHTAATEETAESSTEQKQVFQQVGHNRSPTLGHGMGGASTTDRDAASHHRMPTLSLGMGGSLGGTSGRARGLSLIPTVPTKGGAESEQQSGSATSVGSTSGIAAAPQPHSHQHSVTLAAKSSLVRDVFWLERLFWLERYVLAGGEEQPGERYVLGEGERVGGMWVLVWVCCLCSSCA